MTKISDLFYVKGGKGEYRENLDDGNVPLISATSLNNGVIDLVDISPSFKAPAITVERVSGNAFVQLIDFATVPDDMSVLIPKEKTNIINLFEVASQINHFKWKFNYGRKLTPKRLKELEIKLSSFKKNKINFVSKIPNKIKEKKIIFDAKLFSKNVEDFFYIERGDFHALDRLDPGNIPTISRISTNNGVKGYFELPREAKLYDKGLITISTVSGDAFVQFHNFIATDNVLICKPKINFRKTTLLFIALMINLEKWRFSYGRQPYKRIFLKTKILLPYSNNKIDENLIEKIIANCYGWDLIKNYL